MPFTRRDVLFGLGGGLAGVALTPVPWKLLDDMAIWTQHRRALPVPPRGAVTFARRGLHAVPGRLRPARALRGPAAGVGGGRAAGHPLGGGACAVRSDAAPPRVPPAASRPVRRCARAAGASRSRSTRRSATVARAVRGGPRRAAVMVLDRRPGRVVSTAWRELLARAPERRLRDATPGEGATLAALRGSARPGGPPLGLDLERTRTLVSFGAPVLDGWGRPGRMLAAREGLRVVQVDAWRSPSAALADEWVAVRPGAEGPLALALAHVIVSEQETAAGRGRARALAAFAPRRVAALVGVEAARIEALARSLVARAPAVAVGGGDPGAGPLACGRRAGDRAARRRARAAWAVPRRVRAARRSLPEAAAMPRGPERRARRRARRLGAGRSSSTPPTTAARCRGPRLAPHARAGRRSWSASRRSTARSPARPTLLLPAPAPLEASDEVLPTRRRGGRELRALAPALGRRRREPRTRSPFDAEASRPPWA